MKVKGRKHKVVLKLFPFRYFSRELITSLDYVLYIGNETTQALLS